MFNFMKMDDPFLGNGTFGQLARFGPERCAVMHHLLSELGSDGWKEKAEFKRYKDAYNTVAGENEQAYLDKATDVFFRRFKAIIDKHLVAKWTSTEIVHYALGGDPHHAQQIAQWLLHHKNKTTSSDEAPTAETTAGFSFEKKDCNSWKAPPTVSWRHHT